MKTLTCVRRVRTRLKLTSFWNLTPKNISGFGCRFSWLFEPVGVTTTFGRWWIGGGGTCCRCRVTYLQSYSTFTLPTHPPGVNGLETAGYVPWRLRQDGNPLYSFYPYPIHDRYECRYFYLKSQKRPISLHPISAAPWPMGIKYHLELLLLGQWE